jgi:hypothetical protein
MGDTDETEVVEGQSGGVVVGEAVTEVVPVKTRKARCDRALLRGGKPLAGERGAGQGSVERGQADIRESTVRVDGETEFDTLLPQDKKYVENRVRGLSPYDAAHKIALEDKERITRSALARRASRWECKTRHIIKEMVRADGMSDREFEMWSEKSVKELADSSQSSARLTAIDWLKDKRDERKYKDTPALMSTIDRLAKRMDEIADLFLEAKAKGMGAGVDIPAVEGG